MRPSRRKIIVLKQAMLLKPLAALRTDWTTEFSPSRNEFVEPLFHQFRMPSRSFLSVLATVFISDTLVTDSLTLTAVTANSDVLEAEASNQAGLASWVANIRAVEDEMATRIADMLMHMGGD